MDHFLSQGKLYPDRLIRRPHFLISSVISFGQDALRIFLESVNVDRSELFFQAPLFQGTPVTFSQWTAESVPAAP